MNISVRTGSIALLFLLCLAAATGCHRPESADDLFEKARQAGKAGDWNAVIDDLTQVIALDPRNGLAYANRGWAEHALKEDDLAIKDFERALEIDPNDDYAYLGRGAIKYEKGNYLIFRLKA